MDDEQVIQKNVSEKVRELRNQMKLSQTELANKCGFKDRSSISFIEKGNRPISLKTIRKLSKALCVTEETLMGQGETDNEAIQLDIKVRKLKEIKRLLIEIKELKEQIFSDL